MGGRTGSALDELTKCRSECEIGSLVALRVCRLERLSRREIREFKKKSRAGERCENKCVRANARRSTGGGGGFSRLQLGRVYSIHARSLYTSYATIYQSPPYVPVGITIKVSSGLPTLMGISSLRFQRDQSSADVFTCSTQRIHRGPQASQLLLRFPWDAYLFLS